MNPLANRDSFFASQVMYTIGIQLQTLEGSSRIATCIMMFVCRRYSQYDIYDLYHHYLSMHGYVLNFCTCNVNLRLKPINRGEKEISMLI